MILLGESVERKGPITSVGSEATCQHIVSLINGALTLVSAAGIITMVSGSLTHLHTFVHTHPQTERTTHMLVFSVFVKAGISLFSGSSLRVY